MKAKKALFKKQKNMHFNLILSTKSGGGSFIVWTCFAAFAAGF